MRRVIRHCRLSLMLLTAAALALPGHADRAPASKAEKVTASRIAMQGLGGLGMGALGAVAGMGVGSIIGNAGGDCDGDGFCIDGGYAGAFYGAYVGYMAGTVGGITWAGRKQGLQGSFWATLAGNLAGQALGFWLKEQVGSDVGQIALVIGTPMALSLAAYDGTHWASTRGQENPMGNRPGPGAMGGKVYRVELARIQF